MTTNDETARARTSERIAKVRERFVAGLGDRVRALGDLAHEAAGDDAVAASAAADSLRLGLHNLAGGAPTLGLTGLGKTAATLERRLIDERLGDGRITPAAAAELSAEIAKLADTAV